MKLYITSDNPAKIIGSAAQFNSSVDVVAVELPTISEKLLLRMKKLITGTKKQNILLLTKFLEDLGIDFMIVIIINLFKFLEVDFTIYCCGSEIVPWSVVPGYFTFVRYYFHV